MNPFRMNLTGAGPFLLLVLAVTGCHSGNPSAPDGGDRKPQFAFVTNGVANFWTVAAAGAKQAASDFDVEVTIVMPSGIADQTRKLEDLLIRGTDGIAITATDPKNQIDLLNKAAAETTLITHDSDAPESNRLLYIGMDNYEAGWMCGQMVREALPEGGDIMIFVGQLDQDNAQRRRQGCVDAILGRTPDATRRDSPGQQLSDDGKYRVLGVLTDRFDRARAKANAEDTLTRHPEIAAMVGLFDYNAPLALEALDRAGKLGDVKVISFDEHEVTLQAIKDGQMVGTIVQDPYRYGYESIRVLAALVRDDRSVIPEEQFIDVPARRIDASNVDGFWADLKKKLASE